MHFVVEVTTIHRLGSAISTQYFVGAEELLVPTEELLVLSEELLDSPALELLDDGIS